MSEKCLAQYSCPQGMDGQPLKCLDTSANMLANFL